MSVSRSESYKAAGVDVTAGYEAVKLMKPMVESTFTKGVMGNSWLSQRKARKSSWRDTRNMTVIR